MSLKSRFRGAEYHQVRPTYPTSLFSVIRSSLGLGKRGEPVRVLDLGAGTGLASLSFLNVYPEARLTLVEPDAGMLEQARYSLPGVEWVQSRSEILPLPSASFDVILIGSAWHWMDYERTLGEMDRVLKPGGVVFVFEYQFPKAKNELVLNEWVRRQFNLYWKAPSQVPRGSLFEITECFRFSRVFSQVERIQLEEIRNHDPQEFAEVIFSQSRFLHFEETLNESPEKYRLKVQNDLNQHWAVKETIPFLYYYEGFLFQKRP